MTPEAIEASRQIVELFKEWPAVTMYGGIYLASCYPWEKRGPVAAVTSSIFVCPACEAKFSLDGIAERLVDGTKKPEMPACPRCAEAVQRVVDHFPFNTNPPQKPADWEDWEEQCDDDDD